MGGVKRREACVLCGAPADRAVAGPLGLRICRRCDVAWSQQDDPQDSAGEWERDYYGQDAILRLHEGRRRGMDAIADRLLAVCPRRGRLLDVGAGVGIFMKAAAARGWEVEGVEPSRTAAERARLLTGARVHGGLLEEMDLPRGSYDAVTVFDTLRHLPEPMRFLDRAVRLLRTGGFLLVREVHRDVVWRLTGLRRRRGQLAGTTNRAAFEYGQWFSPRSLLFALGSLGLGEAWVEPSPVFAERQSSGGPLAAGLKRAFETASRAVYGLSGRRVLISPNLLAFARATRKGLKQREAVAVGGMKITDGAEGA